MISLPTYSLIIRDDLITASCTTRAPSAFTMTSDVEGKRHAAIFVFRVAWRFRTGSGRKRWVKETLVARGGSTATRIEETKAFSRCKKRLNVYAGCFWNRQPNFGIMIMIALWEKVLWTRLHSFSGDFNRFLIKFGKFMYCCY